MRDLRGLPGLRILLKPAETQERLLQEKDRRDRTGEQGDLGEDGAEREEQAEAEHHERSQTNYFGRA